MFSDTLKLLILSSLLPVWAATTPLFSAQELHYLKQLKSDETTYAAQITDWRESEKGFFDDVLRSTSQQDLISLRKDLPNVLDRIESANYNLWMQQTLQELSLPPTQFKKIKR